MDVKIIAHADLMRWRQKGFGTEEGVTTLSGVMDIAAITELKSRAMDAITSAEKYRDLAERQKRQIGLRDFYRALAFTHERIAREANLMLDKAEQLTPFRSQAA
jgi:hypothetical protein